MTKLDFTFGITTDGNNTDRINAIIDTIRKQNIPKYQIIIIGGQNNWVNQEDILHLYFTDITPKAHITKKKNQLTKYAKYENIVYLHDYFSFDDDWYYGWNDFGNNFDVAINRVLINENGQLFRHSDWVLDMFLFWDIPEYRHLYWQDWDVGLPYDIEGLETHQYISGGYWVAKTEFMLNNPLDEKLFWGEKEDIEFSTRIRKNITFRMNKNSTVWIMKPNKWKVNNMNEKRLERFCDYYGLTIK